MHSGIIAFIIAYSVTLCLYFFAETSNNIKLRAPNKIALALMYFVFGTYFAVSKENIISPSLLIIALLLAMLGDIFLLFSFKYGGIFFASGNLAFVAYQITLLERSGVRFVTYWWIFLLVPLLWCIYPILSKIYPNSFKFKDMKAVMFFYLVTIVTSGLLGLASTIYLKQYLYFGLGLILFMLSDFAIVLHKFVFTESKLVLRLNSALYFVGMLLIVLNIALL